MWNLSTGTIKGLLGKDAPYGSLAELLENGVIEIYSGSRPANADTTEVGSGTLLCTLTLNGDTFVAGAPENGINMGTFDGNTLKRAIDAVEDPDLEIWKGTGVADGTAGWCRWYANAKATGASSTAVRMDGSIATSGGDLNMLNGTTVVTGIDSEVSDVSFDMTSTN